MKIDNKMGIQEIFTAGQLLQAYAENQIIDIEGLSIGFNANSGIVYLYNDDCQCCCFNEDGEIEKFISLGSGKEGFLSDLIRNQELLSNEDKEQLEYYIN